MNSAKLWTRDQPKTQKSLVFLYTSNDQIKNEPKNSIAADANYYKYNG